MRFYQARPAPMIWMALAVLNILLTVDRYRRHHSANGFLLVQGTIWLLILVVWTIILSTRWTFTPTELLQQRALWSRSIPYESITSVDPAPGPRKREVAVIVYGGNQPLLAEQKVTVQPQNFSGFLAELERRAPQAAFRV